MQTKTIRHHLPCVKKTIIESKTEQNKCWKEGGGTGNLAQLVGMQNGAPTMKNGVKIQFKKLKTESPYDPSMPLLGTYAKELKSGS